MTEEKGSKAVGNGGGGGWGGNSIAERRSATRGFKGSGRINTCGFRCYNNSNPNPPPSSPGAAQSPYHFITIPVGISPTALLGPPIIPPSISRQPILQASAKNRVSKSVIPNEMRYLDEELGDEKKICPPGPIVVTRRCEDGYNWRKYGQKKVKSSQYPRSYYKCTHPNCKVKKKLECSPDGQIAEIIYNGVHNHPKSQPSGLGSSFLHKQMSQEDGSSDEGCAWRNIELGFEDITRLIGSDWRASGLETSSTSVLSSSISDPLSNSQVKTPELSLGDNADENHESESKRRKTDISGCKPRVVVLIESEVDVLDDGYHWRKYGKKKVKGNINPRSYYKCTSIGCSVRKQVERASQNLNSVSLTYEGKHNHEVPSGKNTGHLNLGGGGILSPAASSTRPTLTFSRNANSPKHKAEVQDHALCFERIHDLGNESVQSPAWVYQLKLPALQNSLLHGSFDQDSYMSSLPPNISRFGSMAPGDFSSNNHGKEIGSTQYLLGWQRLWENATRFIKPCQEEQIDDNLHNIPLLPIMNHPNASQSSSSSSSTSSFRYAG